MPGMGGMGGLDDMEGLGSTPAGLGGEVTFSLHLNHRL